MLAPPIKHIQVCCRIRGAENQDNPIITSYLNEDSGDQKGGSGRSYEVVTPNGSFQMDYAFDSGDSQECIYDRIVQPMLLDAFAGFNCSLFSYGQTGSGKTYTLIGDAASSAAQLDNKDRGIIPRAAEQIFSKQVSFDPQKTTCQVKLSILEVYQEQLKDLLGTQTSTVFNSSISTKENGAANNVNTPSQSGLRIREQIDGTVWVEGLTEQVVASAPDFNRLLSAALKRRVVGAHAMNDASSRSHFCCIVNIHQVFHTTGVKINSKIHFIDLAGSEMVRKTDATGVRFSEAKHINKSLSALGNVIYALSGSTAKLNDANSSVTTAAGGGAQQGMAHSASTANLSASQSLRHGLGGSTNSLSSLATANTSNNNNHNSNTINNQTSAIAGGNKSHIPYRDSKLTRLLQNSLGGNAKTVIILTISDAKRHLAETLSTLRFGARARQIQIKPTVNKSVVEDQALLKKQYSRAVQENRDLQDLVAQLQEENHALRQLPHGGYDLDGATGNGRNNYNNFDNIGGGGSPSKNKESVCEICRDFLNLKLREGNSSSNSSQATDAKTKKTTTAPPMLRQYSTEQAQRVVVVPPQAPPSSSGAGMDDDYLSNSAPVEPLERCAICGLSSDEADKLQMYTGEVLGEMFSCDGNCGHQFHVRCVGLLGEGGQYTLPEGEWFCTECYSAYTDTGSGGYTDEDSVSQQSTIMHGAGNTQRGRPTPASGAAPSSSSAGAAGGMITQGGDGSQESADALYRTLSHQSLDLTAAESLQIAPNKNPSSVLATIKSEYHTMRKERNRILAQWQQEKRIIEKYEISRRIEQQKRDQELVHAKDTIIQLESMVTQGEAQSARMQKLFDIMLKELQQQNASFSAANSTPTNGNSTAIRNSVDRLKWASLTVETLLDAPIERFAEDEEGEDYSSRGAGTGRSPQKKLQHSASSPSQLTLAHAFGNTGVSATQPSGGGGIPKPWKNNNNNNNNGSNNKVRTGGPSLNDAPTSTSATGKTDVSAPKSADSPNERRQAAANQASSRRLRSDSADGRASGSPSSDLSKTLPGGGGGGSGNGIGDQDKQTTSASQTQRRHSSVVEAHTTSPTRDSAHSQEGTPKRRSQETTGSGASASGQGNREPKESTESNKESSALNDPHNKTGKSKFINPLKNRLKDLLRSVEAETDAFAEIRQKFKSREDERNQLRHSQTAEK